jgi:peptidoglycan-N-acetylglucosamine deacetylase
MAINYTKRRIPPLFLLMFIIILLFTACTDPDTNENVGEPQPSHTNDKMDYDSIVKGGDEEAAYVKQVYTSQKVIGLAFSGLREKKYMEQLMNKLDEYGMKATFFVPGMRIAEEPDLALQIIERGHEIGNNLLTRSDPEKMSYKELFKEIHLSKQILERTTGKEVDLVRTRRGNDLSAVRQAAAQSGSTAVVGHFMNLLDKYVDKEYSNMAYMHLELQRGSILVADINDNERVLEILDKLHGATTETKYAFIPIQQLLDTRLPQKKLEEIPGFNQAVMNMDYENAQYELIYNAPPGRKQVALTIDDWGSDYIITRLLDVLEQYNVKASFFIRANGAERNPNLARAILDAGHEVASHTYSHPVITTVTPEQLQEEIVKAHRVLTEALQQAPNLLFRPPTGEIDDESAKIVAATGYHNIAMYDVSVLDWEPGVGKDDIVNGVLEKSQDGSIVLLHMLDNLHTVDALPEIIQGLRARGLEPVTMSEMLNGR